MSKDLIISIMALGLLICGFFLYKFYKQANEPRKVVAEEKMKNDTSYYTIPDFIKPVENDSARKYIADFRGNYRLDLSKGVYYDTADLRKYLDVVYPDLIARMGDSTGYSWKLGFYCMRRPSPATGEPRLDFLVVPTRVRDSDKQVLDYFDVPGAYATRPGGPVASRVPPECTTCPGYDAGQLWP